MYRVVHHESDLKNLKFDRHVCLPSSWSRSIRLIELNILSYKRTLYEVGKYRIHPCLCFYLSIFFADRISPTQSRDPKLRTDTQQTIPDRLKLVLSWRANSGKTCNSRLHYNGTSCLSHLLSADASSYHAEKRHAWRKWVLSGLKSHFWGLVGLEEPDQLR